MEDLITYDNIEKYSD